MRIAVCDDEKRICAILAGKVKKFCPDAEIMIYTSGEDLLAADMLPDILLLDIRMPGMSGMEADMNGHIMVLGNLPFAS